MALSDLIGFSYPFRAGPGEFPVRELNAEVVKSDLLALFRTPIGSRVMRPTFGTDIFQFVFEPISPLLTAQIQRSVFQTIRNWEPRVDVQQVSVSSSGSTVTVDILYFVNGFPDSVSVNYEQLAA